MIRTEGQRRRALAERDELASGTSATEEDGERRLRELDGELAEYEALRSGEVEKLSSEGVETLGGMLAKARVARGLTINELGKLLGMTEQQVGRYEQEAWRRASLWRLAQVAQALNLEVDIRASLTVEDQGADPSGTLASR